MENVDNSKRTSVRKAFSGVAHVDNLGKTGGKLPSYPQLINRFSTELFATVQVLTNKFSVRKFHMRRGKGAQKIFSKSAPKNGPNGGGQSFLFIVGTRRKEEGVGGRMQADEREREIGRIVAQYGTVLFRVCFLTLHNHADAVDVLPYLRGR